MCEPVHDYKTDEEDMTPVNLPRKSDVQRQFEHTMEVHGFVEKSKGTNVPVPDEQKPKLEINWSEVPSDFKWAAMDADGRVWLYKSKPILLSYSFAPANNEVAHIFDEAKSSKYNDWRDSLTQRPEESTVKQPAQAKATTPATEPQNDFDINVSGRTVPDDESQPEQATATKHPHADFLAEALKDTSRKIEGQHRNDGWDESNLTHVVNCGESWTFRFADTVKPEVTSPLTDHEIYAVWAKTDRSCHVRSLAPIAIAAKIATLKEVAAMPSVTTLA